MRKYEETRVKAKLLNLKNFYQTTKENSKDSQMSGWNGPGLSYKQELLLFIKYLIFFGISAIFFFHTNRW
jgi:hypothetical protein